MVKVKNLPANDIQAIDMTDGQIGVITQWHCYDKFISSVVQRVGIDLIVIGEGNDRTWRDYFVKNKNNQFNNTCRVQILPKGTELVI